MKKEINLTKHKTGVARSFNRAAKTYADASFMEKEVGNRLLERLSFIKHKPSTILDLGGGQGFFSNALAERYPNANVFNLDLAELMLQSARKSLGLDKAPLVQKNIFNVVGDAEILPFAKHSIDFIFSNCMLHWCLNLKALFKEIHRVLKPEGLFLFSTLGPDSLKELRNCFYAIDDKNLHVNNFLDMHILGDLLFQTQFSDPVMDMEQLVFNFPNISRLLQDIKQSGSSYVFREASYELNKLQNLDESRLTGLNTKALFKQLSQHYEPFKLASGEIPATIEVVYGHAWQYKDSTSLYCSEKEQTDHYYIPISAILQPK